LCAQNSADLSLRLPVASEGTGIPITASPFRQLDGTASLYVAPLFSDLTVAYVLADMTLLGTDMNNMANWKVSPMNNPPLLAGYIGYFTGYAAFLISGITAASGRGFERDALSSAYRNGSRRNQQHVH